MNTFLFAHTPSRRATRALFACLFACGFATAWAAPQLPDFVYQGRLQQNGAPANGNFDLSFALFDALAGGNQVGVAIDEPDFPVTDGIFSLSLSFPGAFSGTQLYLQISVAGVPMLPRQPVATTPVAQFTLNSTISGPAGGDLTGSYPNPTLAAGSVTNSKIAAAAVTSSRIADGAIGEDKILSSAVTNFKLASNSVTSSKIADGGIFSADLADSVVTASKIASGAVGTSELANDSVTRGKIAGGYSTGTITLSLGASVCADANAGVPGAQTGDMAFINLQAGGALPAKILLQALKVPGDGLVTLRVCNLSTSAASFSSVPVYILTLR